MHVKTSAEERSGSQTFMSRDLLSFTSECLIYRDTWVMQYQSDLVKASARGPQRTALWRERWVKGPV